MIANGTIYLNVAAFLPLYVEGKFAGTITPTMVSIILASFELACILSSKIHQLTISKMGRKNAILISYVILAISTTLLGILDKVDKEDWKTFYVSAVFLRLVQGYADSLVVTV